jgi:two-component system sensor histidine kinase KdpD
MYLPLNVSGAITGWLAIRPRNPARLRDPEQLHLLEAFASLIAPAVERTRLASESRRVEQALELSWLRKEFVHTALRQLQAPLHEVACQLDTRKGHLKSRLEPQAKRRLTTIQAEIARLLALADDLRAINRRGVASVKRVQGWVSPAREIVRVHGGMIRVNSGPGPGKRVQPHTACRRASPR